MGIRKIILEVLKEHQPLDFHILANRVLLEWREGRISEQAADALSQGWRPVYKRIDPTIFEELHNIDDNFTIITIYSNHI